MELVYATFGISCVSWIGFWVSIAVRAKPWAWISGAASLILTGTWFTLWLPWFQPAIFRLVYMNLGMWFGILMILGLAAILGALAWRLSRDGLVGAWTAGAIFVIGGLVIWPSLYAGLSNHWMRAEIYNQLTYQQIEKLPETTAIRYLPLAVAHRTAENRVQESGIGLGDPDPIVSGNEVVWIMPRVPRGTVNSHQRKADGFAVVDSSGHVENIRQPMTYGEGMHVMDNILWKLRDEKFWSDVTEIYYVHDDKGRVVLVAPYLEYELKTKRRFGFFWTTVQVPRWGGVMLVHADGRMEDLTPQAAQQHPLLKNVRIFPERLARLYVEAYAYKNGVNNVFFRHKDQIEIPHIGDGNEMPFLLPTESGQKWVVAAVPRRALGVYKLFFVDAHTGKVAFVDVGRDSALVGPTRARGYVQNAYPTIKWDQFVILEPRPIVRQGQLWWMFTITPYVSEGASNNYAGITDTVLVNASTNQVFSFGSNKDTLLRFLRGEDAGRLIGVGESPSGGGTVPPSAGTPIPADALTLEEVRELIVQLEVAEAKLRELEQRLAKQGQEK